MGLHSFADLLLFPYYSIRLRLHSNCRILDQVLDRFAKEAKEDKQLLKATLCLLEVSKNGLLETELLEILTKIKMYNPELVEEEMDNKGD